MPKTKKSSKKNQTITPFRVSVALNIALGLFFLITVTGATVLWNRFNNGSETVANIGYSAVQRYCEVEKSKGYPVDRPEYDSWTKVDKKNYQLNQRIFCFDEEFEPYLLRATKEYFNANGLKYDY